VDEVFDMIIVWLTMELLKGRLVWPGKMRIGQLHWIDRELNWQREVYLLLHTRFMMASLLWHEHGSMLKESIFIY